MPWTGAAEDVLRTAGNTPPSSLGKEGRRGLVKPMDVNVVSASPTDRPAHRAVETPLTRAVSVETLQRLQDRFAAMGRMTVVICTDEGETITRPAWGSRFSEMIGTTPRGREELAHGIRAALSATSTSRPVACHEGMKLHATRIVHDADHLAVIIVGTRTHRPPKPEAVGPIAAKYELDAAELLPHASLINPFRGGKPEDIHRFADVLAHMIATLYGQALKINRQLNDLRTIHRLSDLLAGTVDAQRILDLTVRQVVDSMAVKGCAIRLLNSATGELVIKAVCNLSAEYLRKGPVLLAESEVDAAAFRGEAVYIEDMPNDPRIIYPDEAKREGIVSGLCVPMTYRGETVGVIRVYTGERYVFSESEESLVRSIGSQAASAIINSRLFEEQTKAERVRRQVQAAAEIQRRMLPLVPPIHPKLQFGCVYDPTLELGGDLYDFLDLPGDRIGLCVADVVGKGLPAAVMMASMRAGLRAIAGGALDVAATVAEVNRQMYRDTLVHEFATLAFGVFASDGRSFAYCNAGHLPPLLLRGEEWTALNAGGMAVGVRGDESYQQEIAQLQPGDTLFLFTDGVTDAMNFHGEMFGRDRVLASAMRHRELHAQQLAAQMLWDVRRFAGLTEQTDDITIVAVKVL